MIEFCTKRRMIFAVTFLGGLTVIVLIVESRYASANKPTHSISATERNYSVESCWLYEEYSVIVPCQPCTEFEIRSKSNLACLPTHFIEVLDCKLSGRINRSCDKVKWVEEKKFWIFEGLMLLFTVLSTTTVFLRQKVLDRRMMRRIQRQLANSV